MGNCLGFQSGGSNISPSPSTSGKASSYAKGGRFSASSSSASQGRLLFPACEDTCIDGEILPTSNLKAFSFGDLKSATGNFKDSTVLGRGGFGTVYKGFVDEETLAPTKFGSGMIVAIKKLNNHESIQGFQQWQSEVNFLGRLCHPNLVKLLGYCWEDQELLLVYEFMQRGSLENHLFGRLSEPLSWDIRLKIAIDAAKGLAFLHSPDVKVIYRDFKASNILLDGHYNAKISDFGIAKAGPSGTDTHVTTRIMGTYGYAAPEYVATGHLYVKSDVYGFGVVLLELLTGLQALDLKRATGKHNLVDWALPLLPHKSKLNLLMDAHIEGQYSSKAASLAANLTLRCLESNPKKRPSMIEVVEALNRIVAIEGKSKALSKSTSSASHHHHHNHHHHRHEHEHGHGHQNGSQSSHRRTPHHPSQQHGHGHEHENGHQNAV